MKISKEKYNNLKIVEIIDIYDGLIIYTFINELKELYLAYLCDIETDQITKKWLYVLTNQYSVDELKNDKISIHSFIKQSKFIVLATTTKNEISELTNVCFGEIPTEYVPEENIYLEITN